MVKEKDSDGKKIFQCEECKLWYAEKAIAEKCQLWCAKNNSCNLEIIKYAVKEE